MPCGLAFRRRATAPCATDQSILTHSGTLRHQHSGTLLDERIQGHALQAWDQPTPSVGLSKPTEAGRTVSQPGQEVKHNRCEVLKQDLPCGCRLTVQQAEFSSFAEWRLPVYLWMDDSLVRTCLLNGCRQPHWKTDSGLTKFLAFREGGANVHRCA